MRLTPRGWTSRPGSRRIPGEERRKADARARARHRARSGGPCGDDEQFPGNRDRRAARGRRAAWHVRSRGLNIRPTGRILVRLPRCRVLRSRNRGRRRRHAGEEPHRRGNSRTMQEPAPLASIRPLVAAPQGQGQCPRDAVRPPHRLARSKRRREVTVRHPQRIGNGPVAMPSAQPIATWFTSIVLWTISRCTASQARTSSGVIDGSSVTRLSAQA